MKKIISKILSSLGILIIFNLVTGCSSTVHQTSKVTTKGSTKQVTKFLTKKKFSSLKIISQNADIVIETGENYKVTYQGKNTTMPVLKNDESKLTIKQVNAQHALGLMRLPKIIITIPKKAKLNKLLVSTDSADVHINSLHLKRGIVDSNSGDIIISDSKSTNGMNLKSTTGNIKIKNTKFTGYKLSTVDGQIQVNNHGTSSSYVKNAKSKNVLVAKSGSREIWVK